MPEGSISCGRQRVLITGISGLLGSNLAFSWRDRFEVFGVYNRHPVSFIGGETYAADLFDPEQAREIVDRVQPDIVIHAAAQADVDACERDPEQALRANQGAVTALVKALSGTAARLVHISTDLVYADGTPLCREDSPLGPCNQYARTKLMGEQEALQYPGALVARTNLFGWTISGGKRNLAEWLLAELAAGRSVKGFTDAVFSSVYTMELAVLLEKLMTSRAAGVMNVASASSMSKYEFLSRIAEGLGYDRSRVAPATVSGTGGRVARSLALSLDVSQLRSFVGAVPDMETSIACFIRDFHSGIPTRLRQYFTGGKMVDKKESVP